MMGAYLWSREERVLGDQKRIERFGRMYYELRGF